VVLAEVKRQITEEYSRPEKSEEYLALLVPLCRVVVVNDPTDKV
jgi:hypothetical protein